jgi:predicted enzyme related to lactoylglutathione lyase
LKIDSGLGSIIDERAAVSRPWGSYAKRPLQEQRVFMPIVNALAGIMVSDLTTAAAWYEQLLSRPADARPMEGLAEWKLADGGWIQVFQDTERAGSSSVTFLVSDLDDHLAELKAKGISIERTTTSDYVKTATVTDPAGNRVVFAELAAQH